MSKMFDVYQNFSDLYDELVNHEDYESNLYKFLSSKIQWENKVVGEFGIGTGRVTKNYIDKAQKLYAYDNSQHMIDKAKENLSKWADKIEYEVLDNSKINSIENTFDVIIEGWSFGHLVVQDDVNRNQTIQYLISETIDSLDEGDSTTKLVDYVFTQDRQYITPRLFPKAIAVRVYKKQNGVCPMCGNQFAFDEMQADHIHPWALGGKTKESNCQMLCKDCNNKKSISVPQ